MAIFVAFAKMIEAAEYLGLIQTEAQDPQSRAYRLAHQGLTLVKDELVGCPLEVLSEHKVRKSSNQGLVIVESRDGKVTRCPEGAEKELIVELGTDGAGVSFISYGESVEIKIHARTEGGGAHEVNLILPPYRPTAHGRMLFERSKDKGSDWDKPLPSR